MVTLRKTLEQFRIWQHTPFSNLNKSGGKEKHCPNCGIAYADNFCPRCGQKADIGRITWQSVWESVMIVWGAGNRSMPYSLLQLLGRTGHFIGDYLNGKRQFSYPPFRMMLIIAVIYLFVNHLVGVPEVATPD